ncbi:MAG: hypothetical protein ACFB16_21205 [Phormidesmis sp.]
MDQILSPDGLSSEVPPLSRRQLLNFLTGATVAVTASGGLYTVGRFFIPPKEVSAGGGILAKD